MGSQTIGLFEARTHRSESVARAGQGPETGITRHDVPVAGIVLVGGTPGCGVRTRRKAVREDARRGQGPMTTQEFAALVRAGRDDSSAGVPDAALRRPQ